VTQCARDGGPEGRLGLCCAFLIRLLAVREGNLATWIASSRSIGRRLAREAAPLASASGSDLASFARSFQCIAVRRGDGA